MQPVQTFKFCQFLIDCEAENEAGKQDNKSYQIELRQHRKALDELIQREESITYFIEQLSSLLEDEMSHVILKDTKTQPNSSFLTTVEKMVTKALWGLRGESTPPDENHWIVKELRRRQGTKAKAIDPQTGLTVKEVIKAAGQQNGQGLGIVNRLVESNQNWGKRK